MTILVTWPFTRKVGTYYQDYNDYPLNGWILWYDSTAIKTGRIFHQQQYFDAPQMYPLPDTLCYSENMFVPSLFFSPIYWVTHDLVWSVNSFALLTLVLSFLSAYYCINYFVRDWRASLVGAAIYAFNPITLSSFPFHIQLMNKYFLPPLFLFGYRYFKEPNWRDGFYFWLFFVLNGLSVIYFEVFAIVLLPFFLLPLILDRVSKKDWLYFWRVVKEGWTGVFLLPVLFYFYFPYLSFSKKEGIDRSLDVDRHYSARMISWLSSSTHNLIYGHFAREINRVWSLTVSVLPPHHVLFLDLIPFFLCMLGLYFLFFKKKADVFLNDPFLSVSFLVLMIFAAFFSFGPFFLGWNHSFGTFRLPFYYFYRISPALDGIRMPARFQYLFYLPFSFFAACGADFIFKISIKKTLFAESVLMLILAFILLENYNFRAFHSRSYILRYLTQQKKKQFAFLSHQIVFHYPTFPQVVGGYFYREAVYLNWQTALGGTMINGFSGYSPPDWMKLMHRFRRSLGRQSLRELRVLGVNYVIIHKNLMPLSSFKALWIQHGELYKRGLIYHGLNTLVLSLKRYHFHYHHCDFPEGFLDKGIRVYALNGMPSYYRLILQNTGNCYLTSPFNTRYHSLTFMIGGEKYSSNLKFPLLIEPYQTVHLVGYFNSIKNAIIPVPRFTTSLTLPMASK
jgi:hypothetical protein